MPTTKNSEIGTDAAEVLPPDRLGDMLESHPGPAILLDSGVQVIAANGAGTPLAALLAVDRQGALADCARRAHDMAAVQTMTIKVPDPETPRQYEATVLPYPVGDGVGVLILCRDRTMDQNLREALIDSRQRFKDLIDISSDFSWEIGPDGLFSFVTGRGALGYSAERLVGRSPLEFLSDAAKDQVDLPFFSEKSKEGVEVEFRHADGRIHRFQVTSRPLTDAGQWIGARGICRDITELRAWEDALESARRREQTLGYIIKTIRDEVRPERMMSSAATATARVLEATGAAVYRDDDEGFSRSAHFLRTETGAVPDGLDDVLKGLPGDGSAQVSTHGGMAVLAALTRYRHAANGALMLWRDADAPPWEAESELLVADLANQLGIAIAQVESHEKIVTMSRTDPMTGMLNRRAFFEEEIPRRIRRLKTSGHLAALVYVDLDNFKRVNDVHGHLRGDEAILALSDLLRHQSRPRDALARLGGDEFAIWMDGIDPEVLDKRAAQLIAASEGLKKFSGSSDHPLGISVGAAVYDPSGDEPLDQIIHRADQAMYAVKHSGKGGYKIAVGKESDGRDG